MASPIRDFRHRVALLKKAGLISSRIDARKIKPTTKTGKNAQKLIKKFDAVTSGKATAIKVTPTERKKWKKAGYETTGDRVIVPHAATEKVRKTKGEIVIENRRAGITRIQIPVPFQNLEQWARDVQKDAKRIDAMKRKNEYFGFRFFGNNSSQIYAHINALIEDITQYTAFVNASSRVKQQRVYQNIELVRIGKPSDWKFPSERKKAHSKSSAAARAKRYRRNLKKKPAITREQIKKATAERMKRYRARLKKKGGKQYKTYLKKSRERAKKSTTRKKRK